MFFFANENEGWAVGQTNTILHTSDGGDNWEQQTVTPSSNYASVFFIDEMEGWAVGSLGKIVHTIDGGVNWETQSANVYESLSEVIFIDCDHGWIAGGRAAGYPGPDPARYVLHTSDGGENWETQYYESNNSSWSFSGLDIVDSTYGWAVGFSGAIVRRQGVTFRPQSEIVPTHNYQLKNYPNPFNPETIIKFSIQNDSKIELSIFNIKGQKIKTLANNEFTKGTHSIVWNGGDEFGKSVSSGAFYYELKVNGKTESVKKCLLLK